MDQVSPNSAAQKTQVISASHSGFNQEGRQKPASNQAAREEGREEEPAKPVWLSVVVIGQNEAANLPRLFASLPGGEDVEWLYVDSRSGDNSKQIAKNCGARVFLVEEASVFGPGTGRYIGTLEARGEWIFYLDGDMVLKEDFLSFLEQLKHSVWCGDNLPQADPGRDILKKGEPAAKPLGQAKKNGENGHRSKHSEPVLGQEGLEQEAKKAELPLPPDAAAFSGRTRNLGLDENGGVVEIKDYVTLPKREMGAPESWGRPASYHGGAVLYKKSWVLAAGNWNPAVYQLEEIDLYSRVKALGGSLRALDLPMVDHYTPYLNVYEKIKLNFLPRYRGKNLYGAGQVVASRLRSGTLLGLIRCYPYPFIVLAGLLAGPGLYLAWPPLPLLVNLAIAVWFAITKKWYYYLVYLGNLLQILRGLGRYRSFEPGYRKVTRNELAERRASFKRD